jgi:hypothetical protein
LRLYDIPTPLRGQENIIPRDNFDLDYRVVDAPFISDGLFSAKMIGDVSHGRYQCDYPHEVDFEF